MTEAVKERSDSVPCRQCGRPTWSASGLCRRCAGVGPPPVKTPPEPELPERWRHAQKCPKCGYRLEGLPSEHPCPECGFAYSTSMLTIPGWETPRPPSVGKLVAGVLASVFWASYLVFFFLAGDRFSVVVGVVWLVPSVFWTARLVRQVLRHRRGETEAQLLLNEGGLEIWGPRVARIPWQRMASVKDASYGDGLQFQIRERRWWVVTRTHICFVSGARHECEALRLEIERRRNAALGRHR